MIHTLNYPTLFLLIRKYSFENRKSYLLMALAITAFLVLWMGVSLTFSNSYLFSERAQVAYYFITLFLTGCLSAGVLFSDLGVKSKAINYLLLPGSTLEKFGCQLFFGVLVYFVSYSVIFYLVDSLIIYVANIRFGTTWQVINLFDLNQYLNPFLEGPNTSMFYLFFVLQAMFIVTSVYFSKHSIFKALVCLGLLWVLCILLIFIMQKLLPSGRFIEGITRYEVVDRSGIIKRISLPSPVAYVVTIFFKFAITPWLWLVAYTRLVEKQL